MHADSVQCLARSEPSINESCLLMIMRKRRKKRGRKRTEKAKSLRNLFTLLHESLEIVMFKMFVPILPK